MATAAVHHDVAPHMVAQPQHADEHVHRLASGLRILESATMTEAFPAARQAEVCLVLNDGNRLSSGPTSATGDREQPLSDAALDAKFLTSTAPVIGEKRAAAMLAVRPARTFAAVSRSMAKPLLLGLSVGLLIAFKFGIPVGLALVGVGS